MPPYLRPEDTTIKDFVIVGSSVNGIGVNGGQRTDISQVSIFGAASRGIDAHNYGTSGYCKGGGGGCGTILTSSIVNTYVSGAATGFDIAEQSSLTLNFTTTYNNSTNYVSQATGAVNQLNLTSDPMGAGVIIPATSPLRTSPGRRRSARGGSALPLSKWIFKRHRIMGLEPNRKQARSP